MSKMTLADLQDKGALSFPASRNAYYQSLLDAAEEACLGYCGLEEGSVVEYFNGGARGFFLTHGPVSEINSVEVGGVALDPGEYRLDSRASKLVITNGTRYGVDNVKVVYLCAYAESELFKQAVALTVQQMAKLESSQQAGVTSRTTEGGTEQIEQSIPPLAAKTALNKFVRGHAL